MGRVNRLMERRALRRAAEEALISSMQQRPVVAAAGQPGGAPDQDFEYKWSDPDDTGASYDRDPVTEPIPVAEVQNLVPDQPDDYAWDDHDEVPAGSVEIPPEPVDVYDLVPEQPDDHEWDDDRDEVPPAAVEVRPLRARPLAAGDLVHPAVGMPMPEYLPQPWYRTKQAVTVLAAAAVVAVMCGGWLVLRSPSTTAEQSTIDAPTSAPPAPSRVQPTAVSATQPPPPPPPPSPPPPAPEPAYSAPQRQYSEPRRGTPPPGAEMPESGTTRTPVTRAPISVAPVPRPVAGSDSNTPGDAPKQGQHRRGCFGFC